MDTKGGLVSTLKEVPANQISSSSSGQISTSLVQFGSLPPIVVEAAQLQPVVQKNGLKVNKSKKTKPAPTQPPQKTEEPKAEKRIRTDPRLWTPKPNLTPEEFLEWDKWRSRMVIRWDKQAN